MHNFLDQPNYDVLTKILAWIKSPQLSKSWSDGSLLANRLRNEVQ